jgi:WD40 repeat protein/DNA-binding SARP family transcriptional activator
VSVGEREGQLEIALLGAVEVRGGAGSIHLGGPRQRALLALLALNANRLVSADRLVDALFGVDAPDSSVNAIQVAVSRLRRQLGDGLIETRPGGYVLHLGAGQLDTARFEHLVSDGRTLLARGGPAAAAARLREALGMYHGSPLADIAAFDFAQAEIRRLEELRLAALMDRVDADLAAGQGAALVPELEQLAREHPLQERLRGQLMLALYRAGRQSEALDVYRDTRALLGEELGLEPSRALHELQGAILRHDESLEARVRASAPAPAEPGVVVCPFKGLAPFGAADAAFFFGRERVVDALVAHLAGASFLGLVGPSGSGKSSLLQAGLLPALAGGALPGSADWEARLLRPGDALPAPSPDTRLVVAVDQLEELFTSPREEAERASILGALAAAALDPARRMLVVVSLRADFYGRCAAYEEFASLLSANHVLLGPMKRDELVRAIERPAVQAGLQVERDLVDALVADVEGEPGVLPLLSTSLLELWRERDGRLLTHASYRLSGGVHGAVARLAEQAYARLDADEQPVARALLLRLATEEDGQIVRRRVPREELELVEASPAQHVVSVLTDARLLTMSAGMLEVSHEALLSEWPRLRDWLDEDRDGRRLHAHLAVAAREWDVRGRDAADLYRGTRLSSALEWTGAHDAELNVLEREFVRESRLADEREASRERRQNRRLKVLLAGVAGLLVLAVVAGAIALASRSRAQHDATVALARELGAKAVSAPRIDQAMLLATEAVRLDRSPATEGTLLATLLRSPSVLGTITSPIVSRPQSLAISPDGRTLAVSDNTATVRFYDTATLRLRGVARDFGETTPVGYTPDGTRIVDFGGPSSRFEVRDARTLRVLQTLQLDPRTATAPTGGNTPLLVTPDGRTLVYAFDLLRPDGSDGRAIVARWDLRTGRRSKAVQLDLQGARDAVLLDHGRELAIGGTHALGIYALPSLRPVRVVKLASESPIGIATISADGRTVVFGTDDGSVSFVDVASGRTITSSHTASDTAAVRISPDGKTAVTTSDDGSVILWDTGTGHALTHLVGHEGLVHSAAFSPDGRTLFTSSLDGAIFKWAAGRAGRFGAPFGVHGRPVTNGEEDETAPPLAVSSADTGYAVVAGANTVDLLDTRSGRITSSFRVRTPRVTSLAFAPGTPLLAVTGANGVVQLWDVSGAPREARAFNGLASTNGSPEEVAAGAFSADGRLLAAGDVNHTPDGTPWRFGSVAVWDTRTGHLLWRVRNRHGWIHSVAFSPDGDLLAAAQEDGVARIYDAGTGRLERALHLEGGGADSGGFLYDTLAFAPDGTLATGTWAGILQLWDPRTGAEVGEPRLVASAPVSSIAFAPSGNELGTTGGSDGLAKLWTTEGLQQFGASFPGSPPNWGDAAFTPDGSLLVTVFADGRGVIWPASVDAWMQHACAVAGRSFTREEWARLVGGRPYEHTCGA